MTISPPLLGSDDGGEVVRCTGVTRVSIGRLDISGRVYRGPTVGVSDLDKEDSVSKS